MATIYCDSAGDNTTGASWATAYTLLSTAITNWSTGDVILIKYTSDVGSDPVTGGSNSEMLPIYTADASDVYTPATTANPNFAEADVGCHIFAHVHGVVFQANDDFICNGTNQSLHLEDCIIKQVLSTSPLVRFGSTAGGDQGFFNLENTDIISTTDYLEIQVALSTLEHTGGVVTGTIKSTGLYSLANDNGMGPAIFTGVDYSGSTFGSAPLVDISRQPCQQNWKFINCEFPASITIHDGGWVSEAQSIEIISTDDAGSLYRYEKHGIRGSVVQDTSTYLTSGFTDADGDQSLSHAITPSSSLKGGAVIVAAALSKYIDSTGSKTITIETADDFTTAPNQNQAYIDVLHLNEAGETLAKLGSSRPTDKLATTALASGSSWTGSPGHTHKLSVTVTVNQAGYIGVRVVLGNMDLSGETANSFFYDPEITIT